MKSIEVQCEGLRMGIKEVDRFAMIKRVQGLDHVAPDYGAGRTVHCMNDIHSGVRL